MPTTQFAHFANRSIIRITGAEAAALLDGLLTNSLERLSTGSGIHTGLLSPQGKILFDFFLVRAADHFLVDIDHASADDLIKRLGFYRLRADVQFENVSETLAAAVVWPGKIQPPGGIIAYDDPRNKDLGQRLILPIERLAEVPAVQTELDQYHTHRIALGVPEVTLDYSLSDTFPHEALYDQLGSIDFKKGCYIGQEVVSRMQHRGTARKRAMRVSASETLAKDSPVQAGEASIGKIGSTSGSHAIAILRLDRAAEAKAKGTAIQAGGIDITLDPPTWIAFDVATGKPAQDA